ncbi:MAG: hypothetical protein CMJ55_04905 [Planctomycetaceae bacterium]|nr:hypothetical protein [Planctomycetaceae bacterium]
MDAYRSYIVFGCILAYMVMCIFVGLWAMRRTKNTSDFFMAGRHLGVFVTSAAVFASTMSGFGFVGGPGIAYKSGTSSFWMMISISVGMCIMFFLLGKRLRLLAGLTNSLSVPEIVASRYKSNRTGGLMAIALLPGVFIYLAVQIKAMAVVLFDLLQDLDWTSSISLEWCFVICCSVLVFYCVTGGMVASVYTDFIQGIIMIGAALLVFYAAMTTLDGGFTEMARVITEDDPESMQPWGTMGMISCLSIYFIMAFGVCGQPHVISKLMMTRKPEDSRHLLPLSLAGFLLSAILWVSIGITMRAVVVGDFHLPLEDADQASSAFLTQYAHPLLAGVVFAGLFAAIMSTADSFLNIGAAAIVHDLPKLLFQYELKNELTWARVMTVIIAVGAALIAYFAEDTVAMLGVMGWSAFAIAFVPTVALGLNWRRANRLGAEMSVLSGFVVYGLIFFNGTTLPFDFHPGAFSLLVTVTVFFLISLATPPDEIDPDIEELLEL